MTLSAIIVGSQSILGPVPNPPQELEASMEADMYPLGWKDRLHKIRPPRQT